MHLHLPKPLHGWRAFAGEVGIIVIGVLIALGAEQIVETVHERQIAAETRANIKSEIESDLAGMKLRLAAEPCIQRRLQQLHSIVEQWSRTGSYTTPNFIGSSPRQGLEFVRYDAAQSAGRLALLPSDEQDRVGALADALKNWQSLGRQEGLPWARLQILMSGAASLTQTDRTLVRDALQSAEFLDDSVRKDAMEVLPWAEDNGFKPDLREVNESTRHFTPAICLPLDASAAEVARASRRPGARG